MKIYTNISSKLQSNGIIHVKDFNLVSQIASWLFLLRHIEVSRDWGVYFGNVCGQLNPFIEKKGIKLNSLIPLWY